MGESFKEVSGAFLLWQKAAYISQQQVDHHEPHFKLLYLNDLALFHI